ncbi:cell wall-binding repeat-containing protein [Halalkalibacter okhensis]|uniref:cell wall-binding repeat-containing protein n=1 Tax=Halalkalibacter okhensis TaxID=333138 RepID=UPI0008A85B4E|nr:cell wall-binding repeat-containing protein [Halalkalibacter okhensis]
MNIEILYSKAIKNGDGYDVILYLDPFTTEFANELGEVDKGKKAKLDQLSIAYVKKSFPKMKVRTISIMVGSMLLFSVPFQERKAEAADFTMSYLFFGDTRTQISYVDRTQGQVQVVSPSYFDLKEDGSLDLSWQFDPAFIDAMHTRGVKVVPFLSNHWDRELGRAGLRNREKLAQQIADMIMKHNLDGVNVDIENVTEADRDQFTDLVRLLRDKLPDDKEVSVAVAANPNGWKTGWHGSYDYKKLAEYADYLMLMAYDESFHGGPAGPVASYQWVERSISHLLTYAPSEKVVLGLPFFGRYWIDGEATGGQGVPKAHIEQLVAENNGTITFDEKSQSPYARFTLREPTKIGWTDYRAGTYTAWFENEKSLEAKAELVHKYNLKGTGSWALGQENPVIWSSYGNWIDPSKSIDLEAAIPITELQGGTRFETSVVISQYGWQDGSDAVVLGRGDVPIDALTGSVLAKKHDSPLLLTQSNRLPQEVEQEINRLAPKKIYLAGGEVAISKDIERKLERAGYDVIRISGKSRYDTAIEMANEIEGPKEIILTTGNEQSSDPLSVAPYAGMEQIPIVLSTKDQLPSSVVSYIRDKGIEKVTVIGGTSAISEGVVAELKQLGVASVERVSGGDRYQTSLAIADRFSDSFSSNKVFFASGVSFVDALPGSPLAAMNEAPIILTSPTSLPISVKTWLEQEKQTKTDLHFLGGNSAIHAEVRNEVRKVMK